MKLYDLLEGLEIVEIIGSSDKEIDGIAYDSRKAKTGFVFTALKGSNTDGHKYIKDLMKTDINAVICEKNVCKPKHIGDKTVVVVRNSRKALAVISKNYYNNPAKDMYLIGITGTNGKTTLTYLVQKILQSLGKKVGVIGTTGIFIDESKIPATHTTPESLELFKILKKMKKSGIEIVLMEVSSHSLIQNRVSALDFNMAVFTNLTHDHLDFHKNMDEYAKAKKLLFDNLKPNAKAIYNADDKYGELIVSSVKGENRISVSRTDLCNYKIENENIKLSGSEYTLKIKDGNLKLKTPLVGRFNIENTTFAYAIGAEYGVQSELLIEAISEGSGAPGRMQKVVLVNGAVGLVDYAHTPDALEKALSTCREIIEESDIPGRLICVFGCGGDRDKKKRSVMGEAAGRIADLVIITDDNPRTEDPRRIIEEIYSGINRNDKKKVVLISNRGDAIKYAVNNAHKNDLILIAGKGHETYQIYGTEKSHFDDMKELENYQ